MTVSLEESNSTLPVPSPEAAWYRQWSAYIGVGFMVSVGYDQDNPAEHALLAYLELAQDAHRTA